MNNKESIVNKIKALLAKTTENGATKAEAITALEKANQLMTAYFISEHDIKDPYAYKKCIFRKIPKYKSGYRMDSFIIPLSQLFDCNVYMESNESSKLDTIVFFGFEQDVDLCEYFYHYLIRMIRHELSMYLITLDVYEMRKTQSVRSITKSFLVGIQRGICQKLKTMYKEREQNIHEETGLVLADKYQLVTAQLKEHGVSIRYVNNRESIKCKDALHEGTKRGKNIDINQGLKDKKSENINYLS